MGEAKTQGKRGGSCAPSGDQVVEVLAEMGYAREVAEDSKQPWNGGQVVVDAKRNAT